MNINIPSPPAQWRTRAGAVCLLAAIALTAIVTVRWPEVLAFGFDLPTFSMQVLLAIIVLAMPAEWIIKLISMTPWYDLRGAAREMRKVELRIGTKEERANDALACSVKLGAWVLFRIGLIAVAMAYMRQPTMGGYVPPDQEAPPAIQVPLELPNKDE